MANNCSLTDLRWPPYSAWTTTGHSWECAACHWRRSQPQPLPTTPTAPRMGRSQVGTALHACHCVKLSMHHSSTYGKTIQEELLKLSGERPQTYNRCVAHAMIKGTPLFLCSQGNHWSMFIVPKWFSCRGTSLTARRITRVQQDGLSWGASLSVGRQFNRSQH